MRSLHHFFNILDLPSGEGVLTDIHANFTEDFTVEKISPNHPVLAEDIGKTNLGVIGEVMI